MDSELRFGVPPRSVRPIRAALRRLGANASTVEERYFDTGDGLLARAGVARCVCGASIACGIRASSPKQL
jgi:hypothetical protein